MLTLNTGVAPEDFVPEKFKDMQDPPTFKVRPMTGPELLDVQAEFDTKLENFTGKGWNLAVKYGLMGWKNVQDQNEATLAYSRANVRFLPSNLLIEIASKIISISKFSTEEDGKN